MVADPSVELSLEPGPLIPDPTRHRSLVVYNLLTKPKGRWVYDSVGSSIAVWKDGTARPVRPVVRPGVSNPTLLFQGPEPQSLAGAVVVGDTLYLYATKQSIMSRSVSVAKAPLADCLDHDAWRYYAGAGRWSESPTDAVEIMRSSWQLTVHWNPYLRKYLAVTSRIGTNEIDLWTADRPEGPWSLRQEIRTPVEPIVPGQTTYEALGHVELARDGGRVEYLTYARPIDAFNREVRLMEIVFR